jgi:hypothetical protein
MTWANGKLNEATIHPLQDGICKVRYGDGTVQIEAKANEPLKLNGNLEQL